MSKSGPKGKRGENNVVALLKEWWQDEHFIRNSVGSSGAAGKIYANNKSIPKHLLEAITGDITTPLDFPFSVESKNYSVVDLYEPMRNPDNSLIAQWWRQCRDDAKRINKMPLVAFKEDRKQYYAIFAYRDLQYILLKVATQQNTTEDRILPGLHAYVDGQQIVICTWKSFTTIFSKERLKEFKETK